MNTMTASDEVVRNAGAIAVVMAAYNPDQEIFWTLDSLREQTVPFKLFVTDDGSHHKPDYHKILEGFDYELTELPKNIGVCLVRNESIECAIAQGFDFVAIIDCGDWAHPSRLEMQVEFMKAHPDIGAVGAAVEILRHDKSYAYDFYPPTEPEAIRQSLYYGLPFKHPAMMFRASVLKKIGLYSSDYDAAEDYDLARRADRVSDLANLPIVLLKKVESLASVSSTRRSAQLLSRLRIQWRYRNFCSLHFWLGAIKTFAVLVAPTRWVKGLQPLIYIKKAPRIDVGTEK